MQKKSLDAPVSELEKEAGRKCIEDALSSVASGNDYGLSNYDHIALTGKDVHEGDVIS